MGVLPSNVSVCMRKMIKMNDTLYTTEFSWNEVNRNETVPKVRHLAMFAEQPDPAPKVQKEKEKKEARVSV